MSDDDATVAASAAAHLDSARPRARRISPLVPNSPADIGVAPSGMTFSSPAGCFPSSVPDAPTERDLVLQDQHPGRGATRAADGTDVLSSLAADVGAAHAAHADTGLPPAEPLAGSAGACTAATLTDAGLGALGSGRGVAPACGPA